MRYIVVILILAAFCGRAIAAAPPVTFTTETLAIVHDGSQTYYDPHIEAGKTAIRATRGICCVEAPAHWHGRSEGFAFSADPDHHMLHQASRYVINPRTGTFISSTTLQDDKYPVTDPRRYVDSDSTPMIALSAEQIAACGGCKLGDRVLIGAGQHSTVWAVYGDNAGSQDDGLSFGGLSLAAANALHIPINPLTGEAKQSAYTMTVMVYPGSGYGLHFPHNAVPPVNSH